MTLLYELYAHTPQPYPNLNIKLAGPSLISAFGEKLKIKSPLFMYTSPPTFDNWGES